MTELATPLTIPALLRNAARTFGQRAYVVTPAEAITYDEVESRSADAARQLLHRGVGKGTRVGLFFPNGVEWVVWWLAASRIGAVVVPLSTLSTSAELAKVLRLSDVALLVSARRLLDVDVADEFASALPELLSQNDQRLALRAAPYLRSVLFVDGPSPAWATRWDEANPSVSADVLAAAEAEVTPADLAVMVHTSGSTADPKGVVHTHGTVVRQTSTWPSAIRAVSGADGPARILCAMPFFWVGGLLAATGALHEPVTLLVLPRLDAGAALDLVERERGTGIVGWPTFTQRLRDHPTFASRDLTTAPMLRAGPLDIAMTNVPDGFPVHRTMSETAGGFAFTDVRVVDDEGRPVPDGVVGELLVRGVGVMAGYNKRERAETFDDDGWYHTGDRVYRAADDPRLFYVGRSTDLIKAAGANVSPLEVEAVVGEFGGVAQCVVVGIDDVERGERVAAVVVPSTAGLDVTELAAHVRKRLSAYKVPTRWAVVGVDQIPTLASGKFDRRAVSALLAAGGLSCEST